MSENWDKLTEILDKKLKPINDRLQKIESEKTSSSEKPAHKHSKEVVFDCPECQKEYDAEVAAKALSEARHKRHEMNSPQLCEDCGEVYDGEEKEECPTCNRA